MSVSKRFEKARPGREKPAPNRLEHPRRGMYRQPEYSRITRLIRLHLEITGVSGLSAEDDEALARVGLEALGL